MTVTLYLRENVTSQLTALYASIEGNSEYDQGRKQGILLVATALDIHPAHIIAAANLSGLQRLEQRQPQLRIINQERRLKVGGGEEGW